MAVPVGSFRRICGLSRLLRTAIAVPLIEGNEWVTRGGTRLRPKLKEILHLQAAAAKQPDHVAVTQVELHRLFARPFKPVHAEIRPQQPLGGGLIIGVGDGEHERHGVHQEDQLAAGAEAAGPPRGSR